MKPRKESQFRSIGDVKVATGLTERRIRYYETLQLILPQRTTGNQRLYTDRDIERLKLIKDLLDQGESLRHVRQKLKDLDVAARRDDEYDVERDADSYFEGKRIARGEDRRIGTFPMKDRQAVLRRIMREHAFDEGDD